MPKEVKPPSLLERLDIEHRASKVKLDAKQTKALVDSFRNAQKARIAAESAAQQATDAESKTVADIIRAFGKGRCRIGGVTYIPMSRGERAYLRKESDPGDVQDFG